MFQVGRKTAVRLEAPQPQRKRRYGTVFSAILGMVTVFGMTTTSEAAASQLTMKTRGNHSFFPTFNTQTRDYAQYNCSNRSVTLEFNRAVKVEGKTTRSFTYAAFADTAKKITISDQGRTTVHTIRCLPTGFPTYEISKSSMNLDGLLLMDFRIEQRDNMFDGFGIFDTNGVPLWYRINKGIYSGWVPRVTESGDLALMMNGSAENGEMPKMLASTKNHLIHMNLNGKVIETVKPTLQKQPVGIDSHSYASFAGGYYFLAASTTASNSTPKWLLSGEPRRNDVEAAKDEQCKKASRFKEITTVVVRTNKAGVVNWRFDMRGVEPSDILYGVNWVGLEKGVLTCYYETQHPNWVSIDPSGKRLYVSLRNTGQNFAIDIASKKIVWKLGGQNDLSLALSGDPQGGPDTMHSGSMNSKGEFLVFDNRENPFEIGRAVMYKVDDGKAKFIREFRPPKDQCTTISGQIYCPTRAMGNATYTYNGNVLVNWGNKDGNPNFLTLFDRSGKVLLDFRDPTKRMLGYKAEYIPAKLPTGKERLTLDIILRGTTPEKIVEFQRYR
jgi:hypothetical protein